MENIKTYKDCIDYLLELLNADLNFYLQLSAISPDKYYMGRIDCDTGVKNVLEGLVEKVEKNGGEGS
jgi:hypothetical protein